jgi:hypothetical protein
MSIAAKAAMRIKVAFFIFFGSPHSALFDQDESGV